MNDGELLALAERVGPPPPPLTSAPVFKARERDQKQTAAYWIRRALDVAGRP